LSKRGSVPSAAPAAVELVRLGGELALDKKAQAVTLLDLRAFPLDTDYFLIASGASDLHVRAIADGIVDELRRRHGVAPWHIEGRANGRWVLLDYVDWVAHIFHRETREYYLIERLWGDAPRESLGGEDSVGVSDEDGE
jgi:ribosome-associated protein